MEITLTTPALLFPAISLLMVAFTNRFLAIGSRIRSLHAQYQENHRMALAAQIRILRRRLVLIRNMQALGVASLFCCVFCMFTLFAGFLLVGKIIFGLSLLLMMGSLGLSLREVLLSVQALNMALEDMEGE